MIAKLAATRTSSCRNINLKSLCSLPITNCPRTSPSLDFSTIASTSNTSVGGILRDTAPEYLPWNQGSIRYVSTRRTSGESTPSSPKLPRYIRRQTIQKAPQGETKPLEYKQKGKPGGERTFRSKHYDPSKVQSKADMHLLEPHVLSSRLKKLCDFGKIDEAISMLKNAPRDAMNAPVWNTLIWECLKAQRYQAAYQLYVDMKRRGFSPTTRTFQTMFSGLAKIDYWPTHEKQLANARSLYDAFQRHIQSLKKHEPDNPDLSIAPLAPYIRILGNAGQYQEIFDVYYTMETEGPLSPNQYIFTAMFQALANVRYALSSKGIDVPEGWNAKIAADARLLWTQMMKTSKKSPDFSIDAHVVVAAISALSNGVKAEHDLAFQLAEEYFGLSVDESKPVSGLLPLEPESLGAILKLCNSSQRYSTCLQFFQQVKNRPDKLGGIGILDRPHMEEVLKARSALHEGGLGYHSLQTLQWMLHQELTGSNGGRIRPAASTFNLVLTACWKSADWMSAATAFNLMTGYHCEDFVDGSASSKPRYDKRAPGRNLFPSAETMSTMIRAALTTRHRPHIRQCLRILDHIGLNHLFSTTKTDVGKISNKALKSQAFYGTKLAIALQEGVDMVVANEKESIGEEAQQWRALASRARKAFDRSGSNGYIPTKLMEVPKEDLTKRLRRQSMRQRNPTKDARSEPLTFAK